MKNSKRTLITLLAAVSTFVPASATYVNAAKVPDSGIVSPQYIAILTTSISLKKSSGKLACYGKITARPGYSTGMTVELQQDNGSWGTIKRWTPTGGVSCVIDESYSPAKNNNYRLKITYNVYNSSGSLVESEVDYSDIVYYN